MNTPLYLYFLLEAQGDFSSQREKIIPNNVEMNILPFSEIPRGDIGCFIVHDSPHSEHKIPGECIYVPGSSKKCGQW